MEPTLTDGCSILIDLNRRRRTGRCCMNTLWGVGSRVVGRLWP